VTELFAAADGLQFVRPWWLLGALPALALAVVWARRRMSASHWENTVDAELLEALLEPGSRGSFRRLAWVVATTLAVASIGLAGPAWERLPQPVERKSDALVIVLDLSLSMFARDESPSRLVRARQKITDVLRERREGFTALVVYAGDAHIVAPLTDDTRTIQNLLAALSPDMMPVLGSDLDSALALAAQLFDNSKVTQGRTLLITDGINDLSDVTDFCSRRFPLSVLGVGTPAGSTIPLDFVNQPGEVLRTQAGERIVARLDETRLAEAAAQCHGRYRRLTLGDEDIAYLLATPLPQDDESTEVDREFDTWLDMGYLALLLVLPVTLLSFRRGVFAAAVLCCFLPPPAHADLWDDLWLRPDQQARQALRDGEPDRAVGLFEDPTWESVARYRAGDYPGAIEGFARDEDARGYYNLGNSLAFNGEYQAAIDAYDDSLELNPDDEDARFNRELVARLLEEQQASEQENENEGQEGTNPENSGQPQDGGQPQNPDAQQQDGAQAEQPPDTEPEESDQSDTPDENLQAEAQEGESNRDERQDALEQWLRRVPDDPGGLLRRKFQYETNQRLRRGDYRTGDSEQIW